MIDRPAAFWGVRAEVLGFCSALGPAEWRVDSRAEGWSIADVVAHMGASCHALFTPAAVTLMRATSIESANELLVDARRVRAPGQVFGEYRRWSRVFGAVAPALSRPPLGGVALPLAELGPFPIRLMVGALVFDHHTHLAFDMAPALGRRVRHPDANRMAVVLEWMMAVLANQLGAAPPPWLDRPVSIALAGPGGGSWTVRPRGSVAAGASDSAAAHVRGLAAQFPEWGTRRADWRASDVSIAGDAEYGARFLDAVNIV